MNGYVSRELRATIRKMVASYNRKISYYNKKGYSNLPLKASTKYIANLGSKKAITRELKLLGSFGKKSIDPTVISGKLTSAFEQKYFEARVKASKLALKTRINEIAKIEFKNAGKGAGFTYADRFNLLYGNIEEGLEGGRIRNDKLITNMRKYERISTTSFKEYLNMSKDEKESFMNLLARAENPYVNPKLKQSFLDSLNDLGYAYGIDRKKLAEIEKKLKSLSDEEFEKMFTRDLAVQKIFEYYYIMKMQLGVNSFDNQAEVEDLFSTLYDNIDEVISI